MPVTTRAGAVRRAIEIENARRTFRFLDLPAELRHMIYEHLMDSRLHVRYHWMKPKEKMALGIMALFCVNKAFKAEIEVMWPKIVQQTTFVIDYRTLAFQHDVYSDVDSFASPESGERILMWLSRIQSTIKHRLAPSLCHLELPSIVKFPNHRSWNEDEDEEKAASVLDRLADLRTVRMTISVALTGIPDDDGTVCAKLPQIDSMGNWEYPFGEYPFTMEPFGIDFDSPLECAKYIEKVWELGVCDELLLGERLKAVRVTAQEWQSPSDSQLAFEVEIDVYPIREMRRMQRATNRDLTLADLWEETSMASSDSGFTDSSDGDAGDGSSGYGSATDDDAMSDISTGELKAISKITRQVRAGIL